MMLSKGRTSFGSSLKDLDEEIPSYGIARRTSSMPTIRNEILVVPPPPPTEEEAKVQQEADRKALRRCSKVCGYVSQGDLSESSGAEALPVPERLQLKEALQKEAKNIVKIPLLKLNCSFGIVTEDVEGLQPLYKTGLRELRKQNAKVLVVFAIRRSGCGSCREHGEQLSKLLAAASSSSSSDLLAKSGSSSELMSSPKGGLIKKRSTRDDFALIGIVKERKGVDDEHLLEFRDTHFPHPIYQDPNWQLYKAMGGRQIGARELVTGLFRSLKRHSDKNISTKMNTAADGWTKGGVLIFDRKMNLRYAYEEEYAEELDIEAIRAAIRAVRTGKVPTTADDGAAAVPDAAQLAIDYSEFGDYTEFGDNTSGDFSANQSGSASLNDVFDQPSCRSTSSSDSSETE